MSRQLVREFTVSKSLLQGTDGRIKSGTVELCYQVKKVLRTCFKQWRITVSPEHMSIKLMDQKGVIVLDANYYDETLLADWETVLSYEVMAWDWIDANKVLADA